MSRWVRIAEVNDVLLGTGRAFKVEDYSIAVFNVDGRLFAIDDNCPHQGSSLAMGRLEGCIVTCRSHGLKVNVTGGTELQGTGLNTRCFPLEARPDGLYVDLQSPQTEEDASTPHGLHRSR